MVLQAFQTWFDIEITFAKPSDSDDEDVDNMSQNGDLSQQEIDVDILELQEAILTVNQQPPPVLLVNVYNTQEK